MDKTYVSNFLKEIDEISNINNRAETYIEDRTIETLMRNRDGGSSIAPAPR